MSDLTAYKITRGDSVFAARKDGRTFGKITVGTEYLFWTVGLSAYALPLNRIIQYWRRIDEVSSKTCCCSSDFSVHTLCLILDGGEELEIRIGDGLYRHEPELLTEELAKACPDALMKVKK